MRHVGFREGKRIGRFCLALLHVTFSVGGLVGSFEVRQALAANPETKPASLPLKMGQTCLPQKEIACIPTIDF